MDFGRGPYTAFKEKYPNISIFPYYFHIMRRINLYLHEIKSSDNKTKILAKDLLSNIKLLVLL